MLLTNFELCNAAYGGVMKNIYTEQQGFKKIEVPLQQLMELNIKTIERISTSMRPEDLWSIKKPEDMFNKHMNRFCAY